MTGQKLEVELIRDGEPLTEEAKTAVAGLLSRERVAEILRRPFPPEQIGKLPRVWCKACRDAQSKVCGTHSKAQCETCGNNITTAHLHLDYVGHAAVTDRLLQADPGWTWEPMAVDATGNPAFSKDKDVGVLGEPLTLWIRLTVGGVTRPGVGGGKSLKECVGDAIRNAAMRFGVALDLWSKENLADQQQDSEDQAGQGAGGQTPMMALLGQLSRWVEDGTPWVKEAATGLLGVEFTQAVWKGLEEEKRTNLLERVSEVVKSLEAVEGLPGDLTTDEGRAGLQAAVRAAFSAAFETEVLGPDPFDPPVPF